ncbi:S8 family peptidase [Microcoleus sp. FACHB-672]|uniref:S8 family peptidase n=1 Tax=Microcoleus sp. FACHB-672 TaxID=2692825 RepID=UPI001687A8A0|nr:S8 family peptidase [Microcoleus sp. FACHB-672]MBD2042900.1 peptidase S8 [Microcoleus sp. FACHB-672]
MRKFFLLCLFVIGIGWALFNFKGLATQGTFDSIVLDFREDIPAAQIDSQLETISQKYNAAPRLNSEYSAADNVYIIKGDRRLLKTLRKSELAKSTEFIEPNYVYGLPEQTNVASWVAGANNRPGEAYPTLKGPNDPFYSKQWNLRSINMERAWEETKGSGVTVAVIDTGISAVPDLADTKFVPGYDFVNDKVAADDDNGHGTHVAGTIAQSTNNSYGVAGIAYEASLMPLKVLSGGGGGTISDIAEAIKFAADNGADVINMSLGGPGESQLLQEAIDYAHQKGVVIVAAAGNSGDNSAGYPARYPNVIGVAALDATGNKAFYSNFGAGVDISAPGGDTKEGELGGILQNTIDPQTGAPIFAAYQGTSMASPHVAGVAALVKAIGVQEPSEITNVLLQSARVVQEDPLNHFGAGQLDAASAVQLATHGQITFRDFFRWLRDNGYLNPRFWLDGGAVALLPKVAMVLGSYLLAWFLRSYFPFSWSWSLGSGLVAGSSGLFFLRGLYVFDLPQWPFRVMGSSLPELGSAVQGSSMLNPIFASVLIPGILVVLLLGHPQWKWLAIGTTLGVASCLAVSAVVSPAVWGLGAGVGARSFLIVNALLCYGLARLAVKTEGATT